MRELHSESRFQIQKGLLDCLQAAAFFVFCAFVVRLGINFILHSPLLNFPIVPVVTHQAPGAIPEGYLKVLPRPEPQEILVKSRPAAEVPHDSEDEPLPVTVTETSHPFTIQLVTYMSQARAAQEVEALRGVGRGAFIIPSGAYFQVCIDRFSEKFDARETMLELERQGMLDSYQDAYVRPVQR